ncbi:MAG TPA: hydroxyisourate hydrolase [Candidatus Sulfotelmatobacter sp.]|nr:hydroxyisourate hydrolase [Candidatus Sulfotelmatobacter sp.]
MKRISTHILDLSRGKPASDVPVRLEKQDGSGTWCLLNSARTDQDGRCGQLLPENELSSGLYRLVFDAASYFGGLKVDALYPVVEVTFQVRDGESQFHIPLLLNANGYTTYRGS